MIPFQPDNSTGQPGGSTFLDRMLDKVKASFDSLRGVVTNDVLVTATLDNTRDWPVSHFLKGTPKTWEVVDQDANAVIWRSKAANSRPSSVILLRSSAPVNVTLRFT